MELLRSETAASPERRSAALKGLAAYQAAERPIPCAHKPAFATAGRAVLRDYGGSGQPIVFVPSLINPPQILDLAPGNSMLEWLAAEGYRTFLVDWGAPEPDERAQNVDAHIRSLLLPLLDSLDEPPILVGYCLGGTMALAAACLRPVTGLATIAAPWRFSGYSAPALAEIASLWQSARPTCETIGLVPMEVLQSGFWSLDPGRTVAKFERFAQMAPDSDEARAFVALEDWANAGAPLTFAAGQQMFDQFFVADRPGRARWWIGGTRITPRALACPMVEFVSRSDRIVPAASAARFADQRSTASGHVGMVVGGRARAQLWEPLADWISAAAAPR